MTQNETESQEWRLGWWTGSAGGDLHNPYPEDTDEWGEWQEGFEEGAFDLECEMAALEYNGST